MEHAMEHGDHGVHSSRVQSRSQDPVLQACTSSRVSQVSPPFLGCIKTARVCSFSPLPHSFVHAENPDHSDTLQSTGHLN